MNANGGVPVKTSSGDGCSTWRENVSQTASTSRWKCIVALGRPVVPEVNASMDTSSLEVATSSKVVGFAADPLGQVVGSPAVRDRRHPQRLDRVEEPVVDQRRVELRDLVDRRQLAGAQQRHRGDHDGPGLEHAEPAGGEPLVVRARAAARGCRARSRGPRRARARPGSRAAISSAYDQVGPTGLVQARPVRRRAAATRRRAARSRSSAGRGTGARAASKSSSGHWSAGGRWSRQNVSTWADGSSSMADTYAPRDDGQEGAIWPGG